MNILFNIEQIEFHCRSGIDDIIKEEEKIMSPERHKLDTLPSVKGWTITKPIVHTPRAFLKDASGLIQEVSKSITLSDAINHPFSDLFFIQCKSTFAGIGGEAAS
jgi:hypothetical protein